MTCCATAWRSVARSVARFGRAILIPAASNAVASEANAAHFDLITLLAWTAVGLPIAWGIWITLTKALPLFR